MKFSILIPVYNSEKYLRYCIESVQKQTYQDFEIILVDDGSEDDSGKIGDEYAQFDGRIRVIHQENQGPMRTRINAFREAVGDFIIYLDSDDCWNPQLLQIVSDTIECYNSDLVDFHWEYMPVDGVLPSEMQCDAVSYVSVCDIKEYIIDFLSTDKNNSMCIKAIRKSAINGKDVYELAKLDALISGEDRVQSFVMIKDCEKVSRIDAVLYYYRVNGEGLSHKPVMDVAGDLAQANNYLLNLISVSRFNGAEYCDIVKKDFLEQYLTGLVGVAGKNGVNGLKLVSARVKGLNIYAEAIGANVNEDMLFRRKLLFYLENHSMWIMFMIISKFFLVLKYIVKRDGKE